jgi:aflatoxin B1 aldehyde reductase
MPLISQVPKDRIILGLMTFGSDEAAGARITDINVFNEALDVLQKRGYNELDTARVYVGTKQETFTREAKWKEKGFTLATKVAYPSQHGGYKPEKVFESVDISLNELGTTCVDVGDLFFDISCLI